MSRSRAYFEMRIISSCGNIDPLSVFSNSITWVGQLQRVQPSIRNNHGDSVVQMNVLIHDDEVGDVFKGQVVSFVPGSGQLAFGPTVKEMDACHWTE
jgi:hypothetical protein